MGICYGKPTSTGNDARFSSGESMPESRHSASCNPSPRSDEVATELQQKTSKSRNPSPGRKKPSNLTSTGSEVATESQTDSKMWNPSPSRKNAPSPRRNENVVGDGEEKEEKEKEKGSSKPWTSPFFPFYTPSPGHGLFTSKKSPSRGSHSNTSTPKRFFRKPFPPPSPAKHIRAVLARRQRSVKPKDGEKDGDVEVVGTKLDKNFGFLKGFESKFEIWEEVGRGHFGYTCSAVFKKGDRKGQQVAVKVIPKSKVKQKSSFIIHHLSTTLTTNKIIMQPSCFLLGFADDNVNCYRGCEKGGEDFEIPHRTQ